MKLSIVADELSDDPATAFELGREWGVDAFELRGVGIGRVPRLEPAYERRLRNAIKDFGVTVTAVSPGLFKMPYPAANPERSNLGWMEAQFHRNWAAAQAAVDEDLTELLPATIDFAGECGARFIIAFSFHRGGAPAGPAPARVIDALAAAAERTRASGLELLVETEEGFWADTGANSAALVRAAGDVGLGVNWDPANSLCGGDHPYPDGYEALSGLVRNVHFKDARATPGGGEFVADGEVDWAGQIAALKRDGYEGYIAVEPHLAPSVRSVRTALERLRGLIG